MDKAAENPEQEKPRGKAKETFESLLIAGILALVIRAFVVEAFVVPTSSMAPAIYGKHVVTRCDACGRRISIGRERSASRWKAHPNILCPYCKEEKTLQPGFFAYSAGDRLLVNKFLPRMSGLSRWEIVVFRVPEKKKNFIKRLVGLPGESVRIMDGDLFIDGQIKRKPFQVQENMWVRLTENGFDDDIWKRVWKENGNCEILEGVLLLDSTKEGEAVLRYSGPIDDYLDYNAAKENRRADNVVDIRDARTRVRKEDVYDLKLTIDAEMEGDTVLVVDLANNEKLMKGNAPRLRFTLKCGQGISTISDILGRTVWQDNLDLKDGPHTVECMNVDAAQYLFVDGRLRAEVKYTPLDIMSRPKPGASVRAEGGRVRLRRVELYRDIHYCILQARNEYGVFSDCKLSKKGTDPDTGLPTENEYFFLGDNSQNSNDSRVLGGRKESDIRGKAVFRFWPPYRMGIMR